MVRFSLVLALFGCSFASPAVAGDGEAAYLEVREEVGRFRQDDKRRKFRHHYERLSARLRRVAAKWPKSDRSDDALYVAAQLTEELYRASRVGQDLDDAVAAYEEMAARYPESNLADDALFTAARIRLEELGDREGARRSLERVVGMGERADFAARAEELLGRLPPPVDPVVARPEEEEPDVAALLERVQSKKSGLSQVEVLPDPPPAGTPRRKIRRLRHDKSKEASVVRIRVPGPVGVERGEVPASAHKPRRVFFDLTPAKLVGRVRPVRPKNGVVEQVRAGQYDADTARIVVELNGTAEPDLHIERDPFELQLRVPLQDGEPVSRPVAAAKAPGPGEKAAAEASLAEVASVSVAQRTGLGIKRVVLDAGHGGHDTGAVGPSGVKEKDVNLKIAKAIKKRLEEEIPGIEVIMTRTDDTFIELADRTKAANDAEADLFISIHANANPSRRVRGVETYYLNITHDRYAMRLAARENADHGSDAAISDLEFILADLAMKSNVDDSIRLGRHVQSSVVRRLRQDYKRVNDLGLKHALFFVLLGSKMPAILVETSFLSNRMEEKRLANPAYREAVADGVVKGVQRFVEERQAMIVP